MKKIISSIAIMAICMVSFCGCVHKIIKPVDIETFMQTFTDNGFDVQDNSNSGQTVAVCSKDDKMLAEFFQYDTVTLTDQGFDYFVEYLSDGLGVTDATPVEDRNHKYIIISVNGEEEYVLSQIDNTIIYTYGNGTDSIEELKKILNDIGY